MLGKVIASVTGVVVVPKMYFDSEGWIMDSASVAKIISQIDSIEMMIESSPGISVRNIPGINNLNNIRANAISSGMFHVRTQELVNKIEATLLSTDVINYAFDEFIEDHIRDVKATYI